MPKDWFRRSEWTAADEADFNRRLARSRTHGRAQYLRIQALHLAEAQPPRHEPALALLERLLREYPDGTQLAQAQLQRAESLIALGRVTDGLAAFRAALDAEHQFPNVHTSAHLRFAYFVASTGREALYDEALAALQEFANDEPFPHQQFLRDAAVALMSEARGALVPAREAAGRALAAAQQTHSGFRYHPTVGLVEGADQAVLRRLSALAAS